MHFSKDRDVIILRSLNGYTHTANETIEVIRRFDFENAIYRENVHYYTHLNKRFAPLQRSGFITQVGTKIGQTNKTEKVWSLTNKGNDFVQQLIAQEAINDIAA